MPEIAGVGIYLEKTPNGLVLSKLAPKGPAATSGMLKPNDFLLKIDSAQVSTASVEEAYRRLQGPAGSTVKVRVLRPVKAAKPSGSSSGAVFDVSLTRETGDEHVLLQKHTGWQRTVREEESGADVLAKIEHAQMRLNDVTVKSKEEKISKEELARHFERRRLEDEQDNRNADEAFKNRLKVGCTCGPDGKAASELQPCTCGFRTVLKTREGKAVWAVVEKERAEEEARQRALEEAKRSKPWGMGGFFGNKPPANGPGPGPVKPGPPGQHPAHPGQPGGWGGPTPPPQPTAAPGAGQGRPPPPPGAGEGKGPETGWGGWGRGPAPAAAPETSNKEQKKQAEWWNLCDRRQPGTESSWVQRKKDEAADAVIDYKVRRFFEKDNESRAGMHLWPWEVKSRPNRQWADQELPAPWECFSRDKAPRPSPARTPAR